MNEHQQDSAGISEEMMKIPEQNKSKKENIVTEGFNLNEGYIQLPIVIGQMPLKLSVSNYELSLKDELHCSLICIRELINKYGLEIEEKVIDIFNDFSSNNVIALVKFHNDFRLVRRRERVSVIAMCDIANIDSFYEELNEKLGINEVVPPMHVTLYTLQPNMGIGVNTNEDLQSTEIINMDTINTDNLNRERE